MPHSSEDLQIALDTTFDAKLAERRGDERDHPSGSRPPSEGPIESKGGALHVESLTMRYEALARLGRGGMGEVRLCKDKYIGREVAMKSILRMYAYEPDIRARFIREVQVQGQLEHPGVVPVYDLGIDKDGSAFFTMKRLNGLTLAEIIRGLHDGKPEAVQAFSRRKLLTAFCAICLTVDFAHARGVIHRDLKPANIMLGHFGEAYVLDWGIAKIRGASEALGAPIVLPHEDNSPSLTTTDRVLGTLGYISPEQARGEHATLDGRSDVFSLGAILFELLTLESFRPRESQDAILALISSDAPMDVEKRLAAKDVPPELAAAVARATKTDREDRLQGARELHDAIERFLDGDRDIELRHTMAAEHARAAEEAALRALAGGSESEDARRTSLREVGRALALDPTNSAAMRVLGRVLTEPPREAPREVSDALNRTMLEREQLRLVLLGRANLVATLLLIPAFLWMGVRDVYIVIATLGINTATSVTRIITARMSRPSMAMHYASLVLSMAGFACLGRVFGPLFFMTVPLAVNLLAHSMGFNTLYRKCAVIAACSVILGSLGLELAGVLPPSYEFREGLMMIRPHAVHLPAIPSIATLVMVTIFSLIASSNAMEKREERLREAERRDALRAWHLRQLLPDDAR